MYILSVDLFFMSKKPTLSLPYSFSLTSFLEQENLGSMKQLLEILLYFAENQNQLQ